MGRVIVHLIPSIDGGGAERQLAMLAAEQSRRGASVHVGIRRSGANENSMRAAGVSVQVLGDHRNLSITLLIKIHAWLARVRPDVVQTWLPQMDVLGGMCARMRGIPWILSERASARAYTKGSLLMWLRRRAGYDANAVVANSRAGAEYWRRSSGQVYTVNNAVDAKAIRDQSTVVTAAAPDLGVEGPLVLVIGRLDHQKAVEIVLQAFSQLPSQSARLLVLGDGPLRAELQQWVENLDLRGRVIMRPYQANWWGLLPMAVALISASRFEGQPNVVLEAMAAGCPLIVSDIPEHREILNEQSAVMVPVNDPAAIAAALTAVLADPTAARERARRAATRVDALTIQAAAGAYDCIYENVIKGVPHKCVES